jgi:hypothetical protein
MKADAYFCIPKITKRSIEGSCDGLLSNIFYELNDANEIHVAFYLFNNPLFFEFLETKAKSGCKVVITSLPIEGYSDKLVAIQGLSDKVNARQYAENVYRGILKTGNIELRIFPHLYSWFGALYAGGNPSYSFHIKAIFAKFANNQNKSIITSGNFKVGDPPHSENVLVISEEDGGLYSKEFERFFSDLESYSIILDSLDSMRMSIEEQFNYSFGNSSGREIINLPKGDRNCFFTAPFYLYDGSGSNHYASKRICNQILNAKERVWVCAQHFHDLNTFDANTSTMMNAISVLSHNQPGIDFKFLKQVPHASLADKRRAGIAETVIHYSLKAPQKFNRLTHDKFIVVDNNLIISTANYTPTQFAYGNRQMKYSLQNVSLTKFDIFSESNAFVIIKDNKELCAKYVNHFLNMWEGGEDIKVVL